MASVALEAPDTISETPPPTLAPAQREAGRNAFKSAAGDIERSGRSASEHDLAAGLDGDGRRGEAFRKHQRRAGEHDRLRAVIQDQAVGSAAGKDDLAAGKDFRPMGGTPGAQSFEAAAFDDRTIGLAAGVDKLTSENQRVSVATATVDLQYSAGGDDGAIHPSLAQNGLSTSGSNLRANGRAT